MPQIKTLKHFWLCPTLPTGAEVDLMFENCDFFVKIVKFSFCLKLMKCTKSSHFKCEISFFEKLKGEES